MRRFGRSRSGRRSAGQSVVEFAIVLPIVFGLVGGGLDFGRVYQANVTLQSAARNAAEYAAMYSTTIQDARAAATRIVCLETASLPGYVGSAPGVCTTPDVQVVSFNSSTRATGATTNSPIVTVTVRATLPFTTFFPYPFLTRNGSVTLESTEKYEMAQNR